MTLLIIIAATAAGGALFGSGVTALVVMGSTRARRDREGQGSDL